MAPYSYTSEVISVVESIRPVPEIIVDPGFYQLIEEHTYDEGKSYTGDAVRFEAELALDEALDSHRAVTNIFKGLIHLRKELSEKQGENHVPLFVQIYRGPQIPKTKWWGRNKRAYKVVWFSHGSVIGLTVALLVSIAAALGAAFLLVMALTGQTTEWPESFGKVATSGKWVAIAALGVTAIGLIKKVT